MLLIAVGIGSLICRSWDSFSRPGSHTRDPDPDCHRTSGRDVVHGRGHAGSEGRNTSRIPREAAARMRVDLGIKQSRPMMKDRQRTSDPSRMKCAGSSSGTYEPPTLDARRGGGSVKDHPPLTRPR
jgi:hypothetical protein